MRIAVDAGSAGQIFGENLAGFQICFPKPQVELGRPDSKSLLTGERR
jgi:hypothetical protein